MTLYQLMALCVSDDHARQGQVWATIQRGWNKERHTIRRMLTEGAVRATNRRALVVNAVDDKAGGFWRRRGFLPSRDDARALFRSIADIAASLTAADPSLRCSGAPPVSAALFDTPTTRL